MNDPRKLRSPWAGIEQRELQSLPRSATAAAVAMIIALRVRSNGDGWTRDRVVSLAWWSHLSEGSARRALDELVGLGVVEERRERTKGHGRGAAWSWRRRVLAFDAWPEEVRTLSASSGEEVRDVSGSSPEEVRKSEGLLPPKSRSDSGEEVRKTRGRGAQTTRHNPASYPASLPDDVGVEVELALDELRDVADYRRDRMPYVAVLHAFSTRRPKVALAHEVARWVAVLDPEDLRDGPKALAAWLELAKDSSSRADPVCAVEGCGGRGRGPTRRCVAHLQEAGVLR